MVTTVPVGSWLEQLSADVDTAGITSAIADTAVASPSGFPADPMDELIYATAVERGWRLVTEDRALRAHRHPRPVTLWWPRAGATPGRSPVLTMVAPSGQRPTTPPTSSARRSAWPLWRAYSSIMWA